MTNTVPDTRQAATLVLVRDQPIGPPNLLFMERSTKMAFAPGAMVFPGGAVDSGDLLLAQQMQIALPLEEAAARIAAVRETLEESGLGIAFPNDFPVGELAVMRRAMTQGAAFADLLTGCGVTLNLDALVPFARWQPAPFEGAVRIFDTRFYLARAPGDQEAEADATENIRLLWTSAADILALCGAGQGKVIYPTRRNLERLARFENFAAMAAHADAIPVEKVTPWVEERADGRHLCIPDHLGYPISSELLRTASRH